MMQKEVLFVYFLFSDWAIDPRKPFIREIIKATSSWSESLLIQQPVCLVGHFFTRFRQKIVGLFTGKYRTRIIENHAVLFTPVIIFNYSLWLKYKILASIDTYLIKIQIRRFINGKFGNPQTILWLFSNILYPILNVLKHDYVVYEYQDNYDFTSKGEWDEISSIYNEKLIIESDLIICSAKVLFQRAKPLNKNAVHIRNGNSFEVLSNKNTGIQTPIFNSVCQPIIGWLGNIRDWIDFNLLEMLIKRLTDKDFVFIGYINRDARKSFNRLLKYKNVFYIPYMEQKEAVAYVRKFRVGIIPFKINKYMEGVFPNKLFEYMAAGIPVVTTALPDLEEYSDQIGYARNDEEFIQYCTDALNGKYDKFKERNIKLADENSWEKKAELVDELLRNRINKKQGTSINSLDSRSG